jgi:phosphocarrier protein HPr
MSEIVEDMVIVNPLGMHARPAATLVQTVLAFASDVYLQMDGQRVNAKSIMGLLTLAASHGCRLTVICDGPDASDAMAAVRSLIASGFGEK